MCDPPLYSVACYTARYTVARFGDKAWRSFSPQTRKSLLYDRVMRVAQGEEWGDGLPQQTLGTWTSTDVENVMWLLHDAAPEDFSVHALRTIRRGFRDQLTKEKTA